jgi:septum formation protein
VTDYTVDRASECAAMFNIGASLIQGSIQRNLVLASETESLRRLLEASGLAFRLVSLNLNEVATYQALLKNEEEADPADVAELLTRIRIEGANAQFPGALIVGANQVISLNGRLLEKPTTIDAARDRLFELRGKTHQLHSAVALAVEGQVTWIHVETAHLTMRSFSPQFVGRYLAAAGPQVCESAGAYRADGIGLQLFDRIQGDYLAILGVPILLLFARLRESGFMAS